jgi:gamma-glutamylputrescine oxidase
MTKSYWQLKNSTFRKMAREIPDLNRHFDIAIIGAGVVGLSLAYYLRKFGCERIIVLEKEYISYGASGRNAGFLISGMAEPYSRLVVGLGRDGAKEMMRATLENHDLIADSIRGMNINCDYRRAGSYHLATSDVEKNELHESIELLNQDGFPCEFIDSGDISWRIGFGKYVCGHFTPADGCLDPYAFVTGLSRGIEVAENFEVKEFSKENGRVIIKNNTQAVTAEMAVLATNAYSPLLEPFFKELIFPVRGQMLATSRKPDAPLKDSTYYANFGYDYFRQSSERAIVMGGLRNRFIESEIGYEDETTGGLQKGLEEYISENMNAGDFEIDCRWSGVMGNTIDGMPLVGSLPHNSNVLAAVGCNGHGFGLGMLMARDLAQAIMGERTSDLLNRFSLKRFLR